jgi:hypothetical protein
MKEDLASRNANWEMVRHSRRDFGSSNDPVRKRPRKQTLDQRRAASLVKDEGSNDTQFHQISAHTGPERKLYEAKDRTHSLPLLREEYARGDPFSAFSFACHGTSSKE